MIEVQSFCQEQVVPSEARVLVDVGRGATIVINFSSSVVGFLPLNHKQNSEKCFPTTTMEFQQSEKVEER